MADNRKFGRSSPFDAMLDGNRRAFDALYGGRGSPGRKAAPAMSAGPSGAIGSAAGKSDAARFLDDRYGDGWAYEVADRQRDGDEIIVLCKLVVGDQEIAKSQFGRARIGGAPAIAASADGVRFAIGPEPASGPSDAGDPEEAAFRRAVEAALAKCVELI